MPEGTADRRGGAADPRTNGAVKLVLRVGLSGALALLLAGLVDQLVAPPRAAVGVSMFHVLGAPTFGQALMGLGVVVLTLTPVAGILSALVSWLRERDRGFAAVAAVVLAVLAVAVLVGLAG